MKDINVEVEEDFTPFSVTFQVAPVGRPDSVKVTEYVISLNVTVSDIDAPLTVKDPPCAE